MPPAPGLGRNALEQLVPGFHERLRPFPLELLGQGGDVDPRALEFGEHRFGITAILRHHPADLTVIGEGEQRRVRHGVDGVRRGQRLDVEYVGSLRVLGTGAGPEQPLVPGTRGCEALRAMRVEQLAVRPIGPARDSDAEPAPQLGGHSVVHRLVPPADEQRRHRDHLGIEPDLDPALDAALVGCGGREILLPRKEEGDVDRDPREDRLLDGGESLRRSRDLDEEVGPLELPVERLHLLAGALGVMRQQGRHLE